MNSSFKKIINSDKPVLIDFYASWCGPCKAMEPIVKKLSSKWHGQVKVIKINIDKNKGLTHKLGIRGVPTFVLFDKGKELWRQSGMLTENKISNVIKSKI